MDKDFDVITDLMNSLADARTTLNDCLFTLASGHQPARRQVAGTLRQEIADTIEQIEAARLKGLNQLTAQAPRLKDGQPKYRISML